MESNKKPQIDWVPALFLTLTPLFAVVLTALYFYLYTFNPWMIALFAGFYMVTAMSITGGYHRLWAHRTYEANAAVRLFYALFGAAAFQNSIYKWASEHRIHHRYVDKDADPYSISKGFWYAHIGWMLTKQEDHPQLAAYSRDLKKDKIVMWQHKHYIPIAIVMGFLLPTAIGWALGSALGGLAIGACLRITALHHFTFFINSACHWWGKQTYTDKNSARDSLVMAVFTYGEGYHNYHHLFATDYRNGIRWYHWDPTKWAIGGLKWVGWTKNLKRTPDDLILRARLAMDEKRLKQRLTGRSDALQETFTETLASLRIKVEGAQTRMRELKIEYKKMKEEKTQQGREKLALLRADYKRARQEFRIAFASWRAYTNALARAV